MWIESLTIRGFGCLARGRRFEFPRDRAMLIIDENERGKSTLAAAIVAGLCGFPQRKASGETIKMSNVYRPWDGGSYALEMEIEAGGTRLVVERDFDRDLFVVRDAATGRNVSAEFERDLAEQFLRLPRDDFRRIAFISGKDVSQFSSSANLRERLAAVADGTATDSGAETALSLLRDAKYPFEGSSIKPETAVKRISGVIEEKLRRMRELDAELEAASDQVRVLDELYARRQDLAHRSAQLDAEYFRARLAEVREKIAAVQADINERERLIRELKELEPYAAFPIERRSQLERSIDRQRDIARQIDEKLGVQQSLQSEADRLQVDIDGLKQFSLATDDDLVGLAASADALEEAESAVAAAQHTASVASGWRSRLAGRVLAAIGALCVIASTGALAMRPGVVTAGIVGLIFGLLAAAAGMYVLIRSAAAEASLRQAMETFRQARDRAERRLSAVGVRVDDRSDPMEVLNRTRDALRNYLTARNRLNELNRETLSNERELEDLRNRAEEERRFIGSVLRDAGIDDSLPLEEALIRFREAEKKHARYRQIADLELPAVSNRIPSEDEIRALTSEEGKLAEQITDSSDPAGGRCESTQAQRFRQFDSPQLNGKIAENAPIATAWTACRRSLEVEHEREQVRRDLELALNRINELESEIGLTVAQYRREYPSLEEEVRSLRLQLARVTRYHAALTKAAQVLEEVAKGSRRRWAAALNERASAILPNLNPRYDSLLFDDSLGFTIRHIPDGRVIQKNEIDAGLSSGAKDQIYLAVRLACCEELSAGVESIPIILDDALISFDDERFESGLRHIVETLPGRHQVIILTCHRNRHERLLDKEWFRERVVVVGL